MINIVRKFTQDNGIEDVFISEQLEGWHALTNRVGEGVLDALVKKYIRPEVEVPVDFAITEKQRITKTYRLPPS
jgi:hypothetical protein